MSPAIGPNQGQFLQALFGQRMDPQSLLNTEGSPEAQDVQAAVAMSPQDLSRLTQALLAFKESVSGLADNLNNHPTLPEVNSRMFAGLEGEDLMIAATTFMNEAMDKIGEVTLQTIKANNLKVDATLQQKLEKITEKLKKEVEAEPGFWGKLFGWVGKVITAITSVVAMVVGAALVATGAGAAFGVALFALGAYMAAGFTVDVINEVRKAEGKEPLNWSPTLGQLAALVATHVFGASEETANWIKMGVDIVTDLVVGIAVGIMLPGAGVAIAAKRAGDALKFGKAIAAGMGRVKEGIKMSDNAAKTLKVARMADLSQTVVGATAGIGKGITDGIQAVAENAAAQAAAFIKQLQALLTKLNALAEEFTGQVKDIEQKRMSTLKRCADTVAQGAETQAEITANLGAPMA